MNNTLMSQARPHAARIGIVLTDGKSQESDKTTEAAKAAQAMGVTMYAVGVGEVGEQLSQPELDDIAGDRSRVMVADSYNELHLLQKQLTQKTCYGVGQALKKPS